MKLKIIIPIFVLIMLVFAIYSFSGLDQWTDETNEISDNSISCPTWGVSDYWRYSIQTAHFQDTEALMVCYDDTGENYMLGIDDRDQALIHSLFNVNPMLGRITKTNLGIYENGIVKPMYQFPLYNNKMWKNTMFERELTVRSVFNENIQTYIGSLPGYEIIAQSENGFRVEYDYIPAVSWFTGFTVTDENGLVLYDLQLLEHSTGYHGTVYFMRGRDLYQNSYSSNGIDDPTVVLENLEVSGHPNYGDFDFLAINIAVDVEGDGWARVIVTNPSNEVVYKNDILENKADFVFTEMPNMNGQWHVKYSLWTKANAQVIIAGVLEYSATI
jgi:hypothetical protein